MGRPTTSAAASADPAPPRYRNDSDAVSMHTTRGDYEYDDVPEPPSYSDSIAPNTNGSEPTNFPIDQFRSIPPPKPISDNWRTQNHVSSAAALGSETSIRMDANLMDADNLYDYITNYLRVVPPNPTVRLEGWHRRTTRQDNKDKEERVADFDIVFSLQKYLPSGCDAGWWEPRVVENTDKAHRGSWRKTRAPGVTQAVQVGDIDAMPDLIDFCKEFAESKAGLKAFRVSRSVTGLDTGFLKAQIDQLIRSTNYRGHIEVSFPVSNKNVDIYSPHWVNQARISWIRWLFYLTFLWIFTWPVLFFMTRWWTVYNVEWRFSTSDSPQSYPGAERRYATISEQAWVQRNANLIRCLVLEKFEGEATSMPTSVDLEPRRQQFQGRIPRTGSGNVDAAFNFIQGGVEAWNAILDRANAGGWGADE